MRPLFIELLSIMIVIGIYAFAGWRGLVIAVFMIILFEFMHRRVYHKSIAQIGN